MSGVAQVIHGIEDTPRQVLFVPDGAIYVPGKVRLDAAKAYDGKNTGREHQILAGTILGQITTGKGFRPCPRSRTSDSGSSATDVPVDDSRHFIVGDSVVIGSNSAVSVTAINYETDTLTIASGKTFSDGDVVYANDGSATGRLVLDETIDLWDTTARAAIPKAGVALISGIVMESMLVGDYESILLDPQSAKKLSRIYVWDLDPTIPLAVAGDDLTADSGTFATSLAATGTLSVGVETIAAAGSNQGDAEGIGEILSKVTGADGAKGVKLPTAATGLVHVVWNSSTSGVLKVYPNTSDTINGGSANAALTVSPNTVALLIADGDTNWTMLDLTTQTTVGIASLTAAATVLNNLLTLEVGTTAATGTNQGTAAALPATAIAHIVTGGDDTVGVVLPAATAGNVKLVYNAGTAGVKIYPASGDGINEGTNDAAIEILEKTLALFIGLNTDDWAAIYTANS